jgi:uncharacterized repeat protein (TIGR02543 family)
MRANATPGNWWDDVVVVTIDAKFDHPITPDVARQLHAEVLDRSADAVNNQIIWGESIGTAHSVGARIIVECFYPQASIEGIRYYYDTLAKTWTFPNGTVLTDPVQAAMVGIDGSPLNDSGTVWMSGLNPGWVEYLEDMARMAVAAGGDGYYLDNMVPDYFWGGGYDVWSVGAFRSYLGSVFTQQQLRLMGIKDVSVFDPAEYFTAKGYLATNSDWAADPIWREFVRFQLASYLNNVRTIRDTVKGLNASLSFHGNPGNVPWPWIPMLSSIEDIVHVENGYGWQEMLYNHSLPDRMISWLKTYYSSTLGRKPVWVFGDGLLYREPEDFLKFLIAEGYASGVVFEVPYTLKVFLETGGYHEYLSEPKNQAKLAAAGNYTGFILDHRDLFTHVSPSARVALIYSAPTVMWDYAPLFCEGDRWVGRLVSLQGYALALEQDHVPYDVLTFGHPGFVDDEYTLARLGLYDTVILPSVECVSSAQLAALRNYVALGGRLVLVGPTPRFDENRNPLREEDVAWLKGQGVRTFGRGTIVNLSDSPTENEAFRYWLEQIAGQGNGSSDFSALIDSIDTGREWGIETNAPPSVAITSFTRENEVILHLLNYAYSNGSVSNISLSVKLPDDFVLGDIVLASPDLRGDTHLQYTLEDGRLVFTVPELKIWDIIVVRAGVSLNLQTSYSTATGGGRIPAGGQATIGIGSTTVDHGNGTRHAFTGWYEDGILVSRQASTTVNVTTAMTLAAHWNTEYRVDVSSDRGTTSGAGWFTTGTNTTISISPTTIQKDLFTNYVFEGWEASGTIVSTSPSYSFTVTGPISLTASWKIELNVVTTGAAAGILLLIAAAGLLALRRSKSSESSRPRYLRPSPNALG